MITAHPDQSGYRRISASCSRQLIVRSLYQFGIRPTLFCTYQLWSTSIRPLRLDALPTIPAEHEFLQLRVHPIRPLLEQNANA